MTMTITKMMTNRMAEVPVVVMRKMTTMIRTMVMTEEVPVAVTRKKMMMMTMMKIMMMMMTRTMKMHVAVR